MVLVSLVDGYNLPMRINNNKGCSVPDCPVDLGPNCQFNVRILQRTDANRHMHGKARLSSRVLSILLDSLSVARAHAKPVLATQVRLLVCDAS